MADIKPGKAARLRALQESFVRELPERLAEIGRQWAAYRTGDDGHELNRLVHSLAGSAGTFGFRRLGVITRDLEMQLAQQGNGSGLDPQVVTAIEQGMAALQVLAASGPDVWASAEEVPAQPAAAEAGGKHALIYILEDDVTLAAETANQLQHFGYRVEVFHTTDALKAGVAKKVPTALLADINLPEGERAGPSVAAELRGGPARDVPVIFVSGHDTWQDRLSAVRAGGQAYLSKPINFSLLVEQLDAVTGNRQATPFRVLIVDDTLLLAQHYAAVLQGAGMSTEIVNDPARLLDVLPAFGPDLILMDIHMPGCSGVEAAQVIRQHAGYTNLPIVYLSTEKARNQQLEALRVGGDDFLEKPISDAHLVAAVRIRAQRFRELNALMNQDSLTGLLNHINLKLSLEREIAQALRRASPLCFAMLDIDHFKSVNDTYGHPVGDQVIKSLARLLRQRLRKGDIAARYGGEEFALILTDTRPEDALHLLDDLRRQFSEITHSHAGGEFTVTLSAGIATCPPHTEMENLIAAADKALYQAKHAGRNQVVVDGEASEQARPQP